MDMKERSALDREGPGQGDPLSHARLLWEAELIGPRAVERRIAARTTAGSPTSAGPGGRLDPHRAPVARRSRRGGRGTRARGRGRLPWRLRVPVHDHARPHGDPRHDRASSPPRRTSTCRWRFIRRSSPRVAAFTIASTSSAGPAGMPRSLRRPGRPARVRHVLPARRLPALPAPARRRPRVPGRLDRLLPGPRRRDLHRNHARRHCSPGGERRRTTGSGSAASRPTPTSAPSPR